MLRFLLTFFLAASAALPAAAQDSMDKYQEASLPLLTSYVVTLGLLPVDTKAALLDYLIISECEIYKYVKDSPFKQQEIQQALAKKIADRAPSDINPIHIRVPSVIHVSGYNFDTQALILLPDSQMKKVNTIQVSSTRGMMCNNISSFNIKALPLSYAVKAGVPVSLYRIPMKKELAESVLPKLDKSVKNTSLIYTTLYLTIEPIQPEIVVSGGVPQAILRGQLDQIDLYADADRKALIKRLNYAENY